MVSSTTSNPVSLKPHAIGMIIVLTIEYLLGMFTNLFVAFPQGEKQGQLWLFAWRQVPLALHIIVGFLLFLGTIVLLVRAILRKDKRWIYASSISTISVFAAIVGGSIFIPTQSAIYSFIMAVTFLIALFSYFWGLYSSR